MCVHFIKEPYTPLLHPGIYYIYSRVTELTTTVIFGNKVKPQCDSINKVHNSVNLKAFRDGLSMKL